MEYLIGIIGALLGALYWQTNKRKIAEARNENVLTKEKLNDINKEIAKNSGVIESETLKQEELKKDLENAKTNDLSINDVLDIINKLKGR
jgi:Flp pilus assembly protein TadB